MLIQGQFTVGVRVGACRGRVQEGAQATDALPGYMQSSTSGMEGSRKGRKGKKEPGTLVSAGENIP